MIKACYKRILVAVLSVTLSGCMLGTYVSGNINTSVDPSFNPAATMKIAVVPRSFDSLYYAPLVAEALKTRGFRYVSTKGVNEIPANNFDLMVDFDVNRDLSKETKSVDEYGVVETKITPGEFKCKQTNNELLGNRTRCRSGETKFKEVYGVVGTKEVETITLYRQVKFNFTRLSSKQKVVTAIGSSTESDFWCTDVGMFKFLIIHTIKYLDFTAPRNDDYGITIPEGFSCQTIDVYERSIN
jgi:hypothetical protein